MAKRSQVLPSLGKMKTEELQPPLSCRGTVALGEALLCCVENGHPLGLRKGLTRRNQPTGSLTSKQFNLLVQSVFFGAPTKQEQNPKRQKAKKKKTKTALKHTANSSEAILNRRHNSRTILECHPKKRFGYFSGERHVVCAGMPPEFNTTHFRLSGLAKHSNQTFDAPLNWAVLRSPAEVQLLVG